MEFAWSFQFPPQSKDMQISVTGYSKLPISVNVNVGVKGCVVVVVFPVIDYQPAQYVPWLPPEVLMDKQFG